MISLWEDTTKMPSFPKLDQDIKTDVLIIGGGMAGVLCAYMLNAAGVDYVLAEAEYIGMGITKNTTAKITAQHGLIYKKLIKEFGIQKAKQYLDLNLRAVETFRTLCEDTDCGFENRDAYVYSVSSREEIVEEINALKQLSYSAANGMYQNGKIVLALNNTGGVMSVYFGHELFHDLKQTAPKQANELQEYVLDRLKSNADYNYDFRYAQLEDKYSDNLKGKTDAQKKSVIDEEIAANACFTVLSNENNFTALVKQNRSLAEKVRDFFADFVEKIKNALTRLAKNNAEYRALQNDAEAKEEILAMFNKALESSQNNNTADNGSVKYSIVELEDGTSYVKANRKVITGTTVAEMRKDITNFFNEILKDGDLNVTTSDSNVITINKKTAKKSRDNYISVKGKRIKLSENEFRVKLSAESHIDELAEISTFSHSANDSKNHSFAKNRFDYYKTYFQDFDGAYYEITLSVGVNDSVATVYNVGRIRKDDLPSAKILAVRGSKALGKSPISSISNSDENVKFSLKDPVEETKDLIAVHNISESNLLKSLDLGGFPMPSIAVMKAQQADANADYGDISVVFRKDTIDPEVNRSNKVYGGDAWTPRFPTIEYEIDYDQASNIYSRAHELSKTKAAFKQPVLLHPDNIEDGINRWGFDKYLENLKDDYTIKQFYLLERGEQPVELQHKEAV